MPAKGLGVVAAAGLLVAGLTAAADAGAAGTKTTGPAAVDAAKADALTQGLDRMFAEAWQKEGITPAPAADDAEFLRRVTLDLAGRIPAAEEAAAFLRSRDAKKRQKKIDELLASPDYADHQADTWTGLLIGRVGQPDGVNRAALRRWLWTQFDTNVPYNEFAAALLSATGRNDENPAASYLLRFYPVPLDAVGHATRVFLGVQIQCCQCHNHPYEKWKQEDFYGMAAFFATMRARRVSKDGDPVTIHELSDGGRAEARIPGHEDRGAIRARMLSGERPREGKPVRAELAALVTSPANPTFAKAIVNRVWAQMFGRGFVDPVDDFRDGNPPAHPEVLDWLAAEFVRGGCDLRSLYRAIAGSRPYQCASKAPKSAAGGAGQAETAGGAEHFARARLRPFSPEQMFFSLVQATGPEVLLTRAGGGKDANAVDYWFQRFVHAFTDDEMREVSMVDGSVPQALFMLNGMYTNDAVKGVAVPKKKPAPKRDDVSAPGATPAATRDRAKRGGADMGMDGAMAGGAGPAAPALESGGTLDTLLKEHKDPGERIDWIYLAVLGRPATAAERTRSASHVLGRNNRREAYEDVMWTLLNSTEFSMNH